MSSSNANEKLAAIKREIGYRNRVYPRLIDQGKMTKEKADSELRIFQEIAADYQEIAQKERLL